MKTNLFCAAAFGAIALLGPIRAAHAQAIFITQDTTINTAVNGSIFVGYANFNDLNNQMNGVNVTLGFDPGAATPNSLSIYTQSTLNMTGGDVGFNLNGNENSMLNISGGSVANDLSALDNSVIHYHGGSVQGNLVAFGNSHILYDGGAVAGALYAYDNGTVDIVGTNLSYMPSGTGPGGGLNQYILSGALLDGTSLNGISLYIADGSTAGFQFNGVNPLAVPEPGSVALFVGMMGAGVSVLRKRRK